MRRFRFLALILILILGGSVIWMKGARAQQPSNSQQVPMTSQPAGAPGANQGKTDQKPVPPRPAPKPNAQATEVVTKAIKLLDPQKLGWLDTTLWQQIETQGLSFQVDGKYLSGPDRRMRLELKVKVGKTDGQSLLVCDGTWVWTATQVGDGDRLISKWDLKQVEEFLKSPGTMPQLRDDIYQAYAFAGMVPLLTNLKQQMVFTQMEQIQFSSRPVFKITADWSKAMADRISPAANPWPPYVPREARLLLDREQPYWPHRLEWWGPTPGQNDDSLLVAMEFRDPKIKPANQPPGNLALAFHFDEADKDKANDTTRGFLDQLARIRPPEPTQKPGSTTGRP